MARIRTIKPQHVNDKELPTITLQAHLLWVLSWCFSDDEGVFENDPLLIKSQIFPRRTDIRAADITQWLDQLVKARYIIPFEFNAEGYYLHRTFKTHQKIDRPQPSKIPSDIIQRLIVEYSSNVRHCIGEESNSNVKESKVDSRASALAASDFIATTHMKKEYEELLKSLENVDKREIWISIRDFISTNKPLFFEPYVDAWNVFALTQKIIDRPSKTTEKRRKKFQLRMSEPGFDFLKILGVIKNSSFLKGDNARNWKVSLEFILDSEENYTKILEGRYE